MDSAGFLILSENWYPGWNAYDNGHKTRIFRADYTLRAVHLEKGQHEVIFKYEFQSYKIGKFISITALIAALTAICIISFINKRKLQA